MSAVSQRQSAVGSQRPKQEESAVPKEQTPEEAAELAIAEAEEDVSGDEKGELNDEINSLYNLENKAVEEEEDRRSQLTA
jgi:hypothetical protein